MLIGNEEDLDIVMPMQLFMASGSLSNYHDDVIDYASEVKSFKTKIKSKSDLYDHQPLQKEEINHHDQMLLPLPTLNTEVTISLKHLINFWR